MKLMMIYSCSTYEDYPLYEGEVDPPSARFTSVTQGLSPLFLAAKRVALACGVALVCCGIVAMSFAAPATSLFWIASASLAFGIALSIIGLLMTRHQSRVKALHCLTLGNETSFVRYKRLLDTDRGARYEFKVPLYVQRIKKKYRSETLSESTCQDCTRGWNHFVDDQPVKNDLIDSSYSVYEDCKRFVEEKQKEELREEGVELNLGEDQEIKGQSKIERLTGQIRRQIESLNMMKEKFNECPSLVLLDQIQLNANNLLELRKNLMHALIIKKYSEDISLFASQQSMELITTVLGRRYSNNDKIGEYRFDQWSSSPIVVVGTGEVSVNFKEGRYLLFEQKAKIEWGLLGGKLSKQTMAPKLKIDFVTGDATVSWESPEKGELLSPI